jgi:hypothetical protein
MHACPDTFARLIQSHHSLDHFVGFAAEVVCFQVFPIGSMTSAHSRIIHAFAELKDGTCGQIAPYAKPRRHVYQVGKESAFIFRTTLPRCAFTVISLIPRIYFWID